MFESLKPYTEQFKELWNKLQTRAKVIVTIAVLAAFILFIYIIALNGSSQYQTLFSNLTARDAAAIVQKLEEDGTQYQLSDNGKTIAVSADLVHKTRLKMAGEGLPSQGVVGFEIFDQSSFGTTDFERKVNFYRALGGELSRSIQEMDAVEYARVQITAPEESIFVEEERPAEASVLLKLVPSYSLDSGQVRAITNLVASSVQGLEEKNVTIVDTAGNLLTTAFLDDENLLKNQLTMKQFDIEQRFSESLRQDLRALLTKVLGSKNYSLQVRAKLNFDQRQVENKEFYPVSGEEGIVRSRQEHTERYQGNLSANGGVPGTTSNIPQYQNIEDNNENGEYENTETITNYEINERVERHVYAPGEVEHISVAVVVNDSMPETDLDKIENIIQASIGYDSDRGDIVSVTNLAFDRSLEEEIAQAEAEAAAANRSKMYIYSALIAFVLLILVILVIILKRSGEKGEEEMVSQKAIDLMVDNDLDQVAATSELTEEEKQRKQLRDAIAETVSEQPEEVAQLLKSWLTEE